ncbi:MAG: glyoxylase-like metal-dependent hydrolase (beta-lactamase superfamily II) [Marinomonas primoryensis]|jgi:glyoxylase-like metal-dependent hydrolase (beta-lactamase superfamily II)
MPLPISLEHINLYLLEDDDGWWLIDCGMNTAQIKSHWLTIFKTLMPGAAVKGVICTHLHIDHIGLAGWLCRHFGAPLLMSRKEHEEASYFLNLKDEALIDEVILHYQLHGVAEKNMSLFTQGMYSYHKHVSPLPSTFTTLTDGDELTIAGRQWQVITTAGHSPEHISLYCEEARLLIAGDQVLPAITPNISVLPHHPDNNPLAHWFSALARLHTDLHVKTQVLPAHNLPFLGLHTRLQAMEEHHVKKLKLILQWCREPKSTFEILKLLFKRDIEESHMSIALGETLAHLNYLTETKQLSRNIDDAGIYSYHLGPL